MSVNKEEMVNETEKEKSKVQKDIGMWYQRSEKNTIFWEGES